MLRISSIFRAAVLCGCAAIVISNAAWAVELKAKPQAGELTNYKVDLQVQGELNIGTGKDATKLPLQVQGTLRFGERRVDDGSLPEEVRTLRFYEEAKAVVRVDRESTITKLGDRHTLLRGKLSGGKLRLISAADPLTRDEHDLLDASCDPLTIVNLLPSGSVKEHDTWTVADDKLAPLLGLDSVKRNETTTKLVSLSENAAVISLSGKLTGQALGAPNTVDVDGTAKFDVKAGRFTAWSFVIREQRDSALVTPGMNITAKLSVEADPTNYNAKLSDEALGDLPLVDDQKPDLLGYVQKRNVFRMRYDPRWRVIQDENYNMSMRLLDDGLVAAQCNLKLIQAPSTAPETTLKEFEAEVRTAIGPSFTKIQDSSEGKNPAGVRTLKVVCEGMVEQVPVLWVSYLFEGPEGFRVSTTISFEDSMLEKFGEADRAMLESLEFNAAIKAAAEKAATESRKE